MFGFYYFCLFHFVLSQACPSLAAIFLPQPPKHWDSRRALPCPALPSSSYGNLYVVYSRSTFVPMTECRLTVLGGGSLRKKRVCVLTSLDVNFSPLDLWDVWFPLVSFLLWLLLMSAFCQLLAPTSEGHRELVTKVPRESEWRTNKSPCSVLGSSMLNHRVVVVSGELEKRWRKFIKVGGPFASLHEAW